MKGVKAHELHKMKYDGAKLCEHGDKTMLFTTGHSLTLARMFKPSAIWSAHESWSREGWPIFANAKSQRPTMSDLASRQCVRVLRFVFAVPILRLSAKSALTICVIGMHMLYNTRIPKCPRPI